MTRVQNRVPVAAVIAALLAALSAAARASSDGALGSIADPPARAVDPGRIQTAPDTWAYTLRYQPKPSDDPTKIPGSVTLHVAPRYALAHELFGDIEGTELKLLTFYPSFGPLTPPQARCGEPWCGDEVVVTLRLAPDMPRRTGTGSLESEMEVVTRERENNLRTFKTAPVPSGYEEAFTGAWTGPKPSRPFEEYLVYRDEHGTQRFGRCDLGRERPGGPPPPCSFNWFDLKSHLLMRYEFPMPLLPQRQAIEDGLRTLIGGWQAGGQ